jgi:hypothetical protein
MLLKLREHLASGAPLNSTHSRTARKHARFPHDVKIVGSNEGLHYSEFHHVSDLVPLIKLSPGLPLFALPLLLLHDEVSETSLTSVSQPHLPRNKFLIVVASAISTSAHCVSM